MRPSIVNMKTSSSRLRKKKHKFWLDAGVIDATQMSYWRCLLFDSEEGQPIPINKTHMPGLSAQVRAAIEKHALRYLAAKVPAHETEAWLSEGGFVIFKFWAEEFPEVRLFSGNNPDVR